MKMPLLMWHSVLVLLKEWHAQLEPEVECGRSYHLPHHSRKGLPDFVQNQQDKIQSSCITSLMAH